MYSIYLPTLPVLLLNLVLEAYLIYTINPGLYYWTFVFKLQNKSRHQTEH